MFDLLDSASQVVIANFLQSFHSIEKFSPAYSFLPMDFAGQHRIALEKMTRKSPQTIAGCGLLDFIGFL